MSRTNPGINVVYALYNDVVCDDSSTIEEIGIVPFSVLYMCSDLYEIHVNLCNESAVTLYKSYCTPFQTLLLDLAVVVSCWVQPRTSAMSIPNSSRSTPSSRPKNTPFLLVPSRSTDSSTPPPSISVVSRASFSLPPFIVESSRDLQSDSPHGAGQSRRVLAPPAGNAHRRSRSAHREGDPPHSRECGAVSPELPRSHDDVAIDDPEPQRLDGRGLADGVGNRGDSAPAGDHRAAVRVDGADGRRGSRGVPALAQRGRFGDADRRSEACGRRGFRVKGEQGGCAIY